jgi:transketolase
MTTTTQFPAATELDRLCVDTIRMLSIDAVEQANSGHPGTPMALAPISELHICAQATDVLEAEGVATRLVSMPRVENFTAQERSYRDRVLPPGVKARVSLDAASTNDWCRWVGDVGEVIGVPSFGASGAAGALYKHFGLTPERFAPAGRGSVRGVRERVRVT